MSCKKIVCYSLIVGAIVGFHCCVMGKGFDYKIRYLKRKSNCLNNKINKALDNMSEENLSKYKDELVKGYEKIKTKIDNLTFKSIKDKGSEVVNNILDSIKELKEKLITYAN